MVISDIVYTVVMVAITLLLALVVAIKGASVLPKKAAKAQKPRLLSEVKIAHLEHEELSPEFFAWARLNDEVNHPISCLYCMGERRQAREESDAKVSTKLMAKAGWEWDDHEVWEQWCRKQARQLTNDRRRKAR